VATKRHVSIRLPEDVVEELDRVADEKNGLSRSGLIEDALLDALQPGTMYLVRDRGEGDEVLYVGITTRDVESRLKEHRNKAWFPEDPDIEERQLPRVALASAERSLIESLRPVGNSVGNPEAPKAGGRHRRRSRGAPRSEVLHVRFTPEKLASIREQAEPRSVGSYVEDALEVVSDVEAAGGSYLRDPDLAEKLRAEASAERRSPEQQLEVILERHFAGLPAAQSNGARATSSRKAAKADR